MKSYIDILEVSPLGDGKNWILRDGFYYEYRDINKGSDYRIDVPPKFMTDYASIPAILWWFGKPWGKHGVAAVIHDWLYWEHKIPGWDKFERKHGVSQAEVENLFTCKPFFSKIQKGKIRGENVYRALGRTEAGRFLVSFFIYKRNHHALIISTRDMTDKEREYYAKKRQNK